MRTVKEIQAHIEQIIQDDQYWDEYDQDHQCEAGMLAGFRVGKKLVANGKTRDEITTYARQEEGLYVSHGDDYADAYQSGFSCALYWVAEQYDWDDDGNAIRRPDSIFPAETW